MASKKWRIAPGGRVCHWKASGTKRFFGAAPHWYRNHLRRQRRRVDALALRNLYGLVESPFWVGGDWDGVVLAREVRDASWYW